MERGGWRGEREEGKERGREGNDRWFHHPDMTDYICESIELHQTFESGCNDGTATSQAL